jgi:hypothetical protein
MHNLSKLLIASALALVSMPAYGYVRVQGKADVGGTSFLRSLLGSNAVATRVCPGASVRLYIADTSTDATTYATTAGTSKPNPTNADSNGDFFFYVAEGTYDYTVTGCGTSRTVQDVVVGDASSSVREINVRDAPWSCTGDGVTDDYQCLQDAFDYGSTNSVDVYVPAGIYMTSQKIDIDGKPVIIRGAPHDFWTGDTNTIIKSSATATTPISVTTPRHKLYDLELNANGLANYGLYMCGAGYSTFTGIYAHHALFDGFNNANVASCNNNHITCNNCQSSNNGKLYATSGMSGTSGGLGNVGQLVSISGTAATTAANATITVTGGPDFTTFGVRKGDLVAVMPAGGSVLTASYHLIESVTATTIVTQANYYNRPQYTASGLEYAIGVGSGWRDMRNGNGGVSVLNNCTFFGNGSSGIHMDAAYGHLVTSGDVSYNGLAGISFGVSDNSGAITGAQINNLYCEDVAMCYFLGAGSIVINSMNGTSFDTIGADLTTVYGTEIQGADAIINTAGTEYIWEQGEMQNFVLQVRNNGGTIEHRIVGEFMSSAGSGSASSAANRVAGASTTYAVSPALSAGTGFTSGGGILSSTSFVLNNTRTQSSTLALTAVIENNTTGTGFTATIGPLLATNIGGTTRNWARVYLLNSSGTSVNWSTANIPAGSYVAVRITGRLR